MDIKEDDFQNEFKLEIDEKPLVNYELEGKGITESKTRRGSSEFNEKQIQSESFHSHSFKEEQVTIKAEEGDQFSTDEFNEKQIQDESFHSHSFKEVTIKTEEGDQFSTDCKIQKEEYTSEGGTTVCGLYTEEHFVKPELVVPEEILSMTDDHEKNNQSLTIKSENGPVFKCVTCNYQTHRKSNFSRHVLRHTPKTIKCPCCPYKTSENRLLKLHKLVHLSKGEAQMYKCPECNFSSKRKATVTQHLLMHKKPDEITWYQCPECPYKTKYKSFLLYGHMLLHRQDQPMHKCSLCSYQSPRKRSLRTHLTLVHRPKDVPLISCPEEDCLFKTHGESYLARHIKKLHKWKTIFKCSNCSFRTKYMDSLTEHELRHEMPDS